MPKIHVGISRSATSGLSLHISKKKWQAIKARVCWRSKTTKPTRTTRLLTSEMKQNDSCVQVWENTIISYTSLVKWLQLYQSTQAKRQSSSLQSVDKISSINASNTETVIITDSACRSSRIPSFVNHASQRLSYINNIQNISPVHGTSQWWKD